MNKLHRRAKRSKLTEDWDRFRQFRNFVTLKKRERKNESLEKLDIKASDPTRFGQKDWWKLVKSFMEKKGIGLDEIPSIDCNGQIFYSNKEKDEIFNDFFIKEATLNNEDDTPPDIPQLDCQLDEIVLSVMEVKNVIKNLDKNKATCPDTIHNRLLIAAADVVSEPLTNVFNRCLNESKVPSQWKIAHVTPIHKKNGQ